MAFAGSLIVAVTGATGLVGRRLVQDLSLDGRIERVVAVGRNAGALEELASADRDKISFAIADINDIEALRKAFDGCAVVVHAAGFVDPLADREAIFKVNVQGTRCAIDAATLAGCKQFIQISSLSVITGQGDQYDLDESAPLVMCGENYADSKVEAEKTAHQMLDGNLSLGDEALQLTILRPGFIYGPHEQAWMPRLLNSIRSGQAALIDGGKRMTNVVYVGNLSRAVSLSLLNPKAYGQDFNITDGQKISKKDLFDALADGMGYPRVTRKIPRPLFAMASAVVSKIAPHLSVEARTKLARFSPGAFRLAAVNQGFSIKKAENLLNYVDRIPFATAMKDTLQYFKAEK